MKFPFWAWLLKLPKPERSLVFTFALGLLVSFAALVIGSFYEKTREVGAFGGSIAGGFVGTPHYLNPVLAPANEVDRALTKLLYPALLGYSEEGKLVPSLASSFAIGDNGKIYEFFLRKDAEWDDGTPINAYDVVFTIKTIQDPKIASPLARLWEGVRVEATNDLTVRFTLSEPYAFFLQNVTLGILPRHTWGEVTQENFALSEYNKEPVGGGAYSFGGFTKSDSEITSIVLKANQTFFGGPPYISKLTMRFYASAEDLLRAYQRGAIDFFGVPAGALAGQIKEAKGNTTAFPLPRYFAIFLNEKANPALSKKALREALLTAIDRDAIVSSLLRGQARKVTSAIPWVLDEYHNGDLPEYPYNPSRAKELLASSGFSEKKPLSLELTVVNDDSLNQVAKNIEESWKAIGIRVTIKTRELSELRDQVLQKRSYQAFLFGQALALEPVLTNDSIKGEHEATLSLPEDYIAQIPDWYIYTKRASK
ncbi:MAG: hypothetical protein HY001_00040 [Candidatus Portnoybacteria bacterium]|nr:hypothetical protein [Candidatus Portnoybacteria bacterium]